MKMTTRRARINRTERMVAETSDWVPTVSPTADLAAALAEAPLFAGCDQRDTARILAEFDDARFPSGRRIVLEGLRGSDFFGEIAVLGDGLRSASVRSETPLQCLVLPNGKLEQLILDHPQLGINLIHTVIGRFQDVAGRRQPPASEVASA